MRLGTHACVAVALALGACQSIAGLGDFTDQLTTSTAATGTAGTSAAGSGGAATGGSGGSTGGTGGAGGTAGAGGTGGGVGGGHPLDFFDDFNRFNSEAIGNNWIEKTPEAFSVLSNAVHKGTSPASFRDQLVYRPGSENLLDVEASVEVVLVNTPAEFPELFVRATGHSTPDAIDAYALFLNGDDSATLLRLEGTTLGTGLETVTLTTTFTAGGRYRLTLSAVGTAPVQLNARVEAFTGATWQNIGSSTQTDQGASAHTVPGAVGFIGSGSSANVIFDNFRRTVL